MKDGSQIDLEMQVVPFAFWERRILFYLSRMYTEQIKAGENYGEMKRCIHVSILNFIHFPEDQICFREIALCDLQTKKKYTDLLEIYVLELKKLPPEQLKEPMIIQWMRFLSAQKKEDFEKMAEKDGYIGEAYGVLKKLSADEQKRLEYEARQKAILDYNSQVIGYTEKGVQMGEERLGRLCEALMDAGRMEDLKKAVSNEEYRKELYQEFGHIIDEDRYKESCPLTSGTDARGQLFHRLLHQVRYRHETVPLPGAEDISFPCG